MLHQPYTVSVSVLESVLGYEIISANTLPKGIPSMATLKLHDGIYQYNGAGLNFIDQENYFNIMYIILQYSN